MSKDFEVFLRERVAAAEDFINGDFAMLGSLCAAHDPATFFSPQGDRVTGAIAVKNRYEKDTSLFQSGISSMDILHSGSDGDLGYWTGLQRARGRMKGQEEERDFNLRVTELFRREEGKWKLIHRHADALRGQS